LTAPTSKQSLIVSCYIHNKKVILVKLYQVLTQNFIKMHPTQINQWKFQ